MFRSTTSARTQTRVRLGTLQLLVASTSTDRSTRSLAAQTSPDTNEDYGTINKSITSLRAFACASAPCIWVRRPESVRKGTDLDNARLTCLRSGRSVTSLWTGGPCAARLLVRLGPAQLTGTSRKSRRPRFRPTVRRRTPAARLPPLLTGLRGNATLPAARHVSRHTRSGKSDGQCQALRALTIRGQYQVRFGTIQLDRIQESIATHDALLPFNRPATCPGRSLDVERRTARPHLQ